MKTSTMVFLGGAVALGYYLYKKQTDPLTAATTGSSTATSALTHGASPPFANPAATSQLAPDDSAEDDYSDVSVPSYAWQAPTYGARAWSGGGRRHRRGGR